MLRFGAACFALATGATPLHAEAPPAFLTRWGSYGEAPGQFYDGLAIALTPDGNVVTGEYGARRIQKFTPTGGLLELKVTGVWISGMAIDPLGFLYVAHPAQARVLKYSGDLRLVAQWGSPGTGDGQFSRAHTVAVDQSGHVFVTDSDLARVSKFTSDGVFLAKWGEPGPGDGQFNAVNGIACGPDGSVFVVDRLNHRIQKFTNDGVFVAKWGAYGSGEGQFANPLGVATDLHGNVYVSDAGNPPLGISKFTGDGLFLSRWGGLGGGPGAVNEPWALAVDADMAVFAMDRAAGAVVKYGYAPTSATRTSWSRLKALYR